MSAEDPTMHYYSIFQQLFKFIPRYRFDKKAEETSGNRYCKHFSGSAAIDRPGFFFAAIPTTAGSKRRHEPDSVVAEARALIDTAFADPVSLKNAELTRRMLYGSIDRRFFLEYFDFILEHRDDLNWIYGCYSLIKLCRTRNIPLKFKDLSPDAADFAARRKLWDFMEDIPMEKSPCAECLKIIEELRRTIC